LGVSAFLRNAQEILDVATAASGEDCDLTLVVDGAGVIRVLSEPGWAWNGLRAQFGPGAAYRVRRAGAKVRVEGASGADRCLLESGGPAPPDTPARRILLDRPAYRVQLALAGA
jgi:hypothetical protein